MTARVIVVALTLVFAAPAGAQTIGADLDRPANAPNTCRQLPSTDPFGGRAYIAPIFVRDGISCTYLGTGPPVAPTREITGAPGPGIVTAVRVKVGPVTGPMVVTVLQTQRSTNDPATPENPDRVGAGFVCCIHAGATPIFTPAPNAITTVATRLPMRFDFNADVGETRDYLGLTVIGLDTPIPAHDTGTSNDVNAPSALAFFPGVAPGDIRADGAGVRGYVPLLNADFVALCRGAALRSTAAAAQSSRCAPRAGLLNGRVTITRGGLLLSLPCNLASACSGVARVESASGRSRGRRTTFATRRFKLAAGAAKSLTAPLSAPGRRFVRGRRTVGAWVNVRLGKQLVAAHRVTLRR
jgi:hypothetical protein